jgi:hypothetical protein
MRSHPLSPAIGNDPYMHKAIFHGLLGLVEIGAALDAAGEVTMVV